MPDAEVRTKMVASSSEFNAAWRTAIENGPKAMKRELAELERQSERGAQEAGRSYNQAGESMVGSFRRAAIEAVSFNKLLDAGLQIALQTLEKLKEAEQFRQQTTLSVDESSRQLALQASLTDAERRQEVQDSFQVGSKLAIDSQIITAIQTQLASSGFDRETVLGEGGSIVARAGLASNYNREDLGKFVEATKAAGLFLSATGGKEQLTGDNLSRVLVGSQRLFKDTNLQLSSLSAIAEEGGVLSTSTGASQEEILATYAFMLGKQGQAKAATSFRSFGQSLVGLREDSAQGKALSELGLRPEDVDFRGEGETYLGTLELLKDRLKTVDQASAARISKTLFGAEGGSAASALLTDEGLAEIRKNIGVQSDTAGFNADLDIVTQGYAADLKRQQVLKEFASVSDKSGANAVEDARLETVRAQQMQRGDYLRSGFGTIQDTIIGNDTVRGTATAFGVRSEDFNAVTQAESGGMVASGFYTAAAGGNPIGGAMLKLLTEQLFVLEGIRDDQKNAPTRPAAAAMSNQ